MTIENDFKTLNDFSQPLENSVFDEFMAFSERLLDNGILLEVKDVIALFKMWQADQK